jgi:hypothetical protein
MEQLATWCQLENDEVVLLRLLEVDKLDDIRVVELPHDLHFLQDIRPLDALSASVQGGMVRAQRRQQSLLKTECCNTKHR